MTDFVFIDSGIGGIPYMTALRERSKKSSCVYVADSANFPYGQKSHSEVVDCVKPLVKKIREQFAPSVIVLACNTISVNALEELRREFPDQQFVGTVPAIKLAASVSKKRRLGLLATNATVHNSYNDYLMKSFASDCELINRGDAALIEFIEKNGLTATPAQIEKAVEPAVEFFRSNDCDVIILGCTHFLNISDEIKNACKPDIQVVDSVDGVVRHALEVAGVLGAEPYEQSSPGDSLKTVHRTVFTPRCGAAPYLGEGVTEDRKAGWSQGETSPSLFITKALDESTQKQYNALCKKFGINFKGVLAL